MGMKLKNLYLTGGLLVLCVGWICPDAVVADQAEAAQQILQATSVKGGLIVHLGCGDGKLTAALRVNDGYVVHGLDSKAANIRKTRQHINALGLGGKVTAERWKDKWLPYTDNLVNLLVAEDLGKIPMAEVLRVLVPNGVAYIKKDGSWTKTVKPRPETIDEWTHYLHDPTNNAVADDTVVAPPRRTQWVGKPKWTRHHDQMSSISALVSAGGRIFYIIDEGSTASNHTSPKWSLIARDAFNGIILWKKPIAKWFNHRWPLKSGPAQLPRRLVAVGDRVYVTLGIKAPLVALEAATGNVIRTYEGTKSTREVMVSKDTLFVVADDSPNNHEDYKQQGDTCWQEMIRVGRRRPWDDKKDRRILAIRAATGEIIWQKPSVIMPLSLAVAKQHVYFHDGEKIVCLHRLDGKELWHTEPVGRRHPIPLSFAPTLVIYEDVVLFSGGLKLLTGFSTNDGKTLWTAEHPRSGHQSPEDVLVIDGLVWSGPIASSNSTGIFTGRDPRTGEVKKEFSPDAKPYWFHHRCYRSKATSQFILTSRTGIEFVDLESKHWTPNHWVRGGCVYGIMPCNGLIYAPPHPCICYAESKLSGFYALAPASSQQPTRDEGLDDKRLRRGPGYAREVRLSAQSSGQGDWPTYRHDPTRSGFTKSTVPAALDRKWQVDLGGKLTSMVSARNKVFLASVDTHTIYALNANTGKQRWTYTAGGRIDSPPTIYHDQVLFGSADGWVYCLNADDGLLVWRFRAAPQDTKVVSCGQLESAWPVHGSVLIQDNVLYCVAGRSMFLDGGLRLLRLDPATGKKLSETVLNDRDPKTGEDFHTKVSNLNMPVALPDILSSDGESLFMRSQQFDLQGVRKDFSKPGHPTQIASRQLGEGKHLFCSTGFLDDTGFHRSYWIYGRKFSGGCDWWFRNGKFAPAGKLLVFDDESVYGFGRKPELFCWTPALEYQLFSADKEADRNAIKRVVNYDAKMHSKYREVIYIRKLWKKAALEDVSAINFKWSKRDPSLQARAMVLANKTLFVAGPPDVVDEEEATSRPYDADIQAKLKEQTAILAGQKGSLLWAVSATDGNKLAEYKLDHLPVFDGMIAANEKLYIATTDGKVTCYAGK